MKYIFAILLMSFCSSTYALEYSIQSEDDVYATEDYVVESAYAREFNPKSFESKVKEINKAISKTSGKSKLLNIPLSDTDQDRFIERYYKINRYDAFLNEKGELTIYLKPQQISLQ